MTATDHDRLAETSVYADALLGATARIVDTVHNPHSTPTAVAQAVDAALAIEAPPGLDPAVALAVVLAAQVRPGGDVGERVAWTFTDPRFLHAAVSAADPERGVVARTAIDSGRFEQLPYQQQVDVVAACAGDGLSVAQTATRLRCSTRKVTELRREHRRTATETPVAVAS